MNLFKEGLKEEDEVYCILNTAIRGRITQKANRHGIYLYTIEVEDSREFKKWFDVADVSVVFLHWQLAKIYKTEVKKKCKKKKKQTPKKKSLKKKKS